MIKSTFLNIINSHQYHEYHDFLTEVKCISQKLMHFILYLVD